MLNRTEVLVRHCTWLLVALLALFSALPAGTASAAPAASVPTAPAQGPNAPTAPKGKEKGEKPPVPAYSEFSQRTPAEQGAILMAYGKFLASVEADGRLPSVSAQSCGGSQEFECPALYAHRCVRVPQGSLQHLHRSCNDFCAGNSRCFEIAAAAIGLNEYVRIESLVSPLCAPKGKEAGKEPCLRLIESLEVISRGELPKALPSPSPSPSASAAPQASRWAGKCEYVVLNGRNQQEIWVLSLPGASEPLRICQATLRCQEGKVSRSPVTALCMAEGESVQAARCPSDASACAADLRIQSQGDFLEAESGPKGASPKGSP